MGNETQVKQEGGTDTSQYPNIYWYGKSNTTKKPSFKSNVTNIKDAVFTQGCPSDFEKY